MELTDAEWRSLVALLVELQKQHQAVVAQLMAEEAIEIALEQGPWWMELSGDRERWCLRFVLSCPSGRGAEGSWQPPASAELCLALAKAGSF